MRRSKYLIVILLIFGGLVLIVNQAFLYSNKTTHPYLVEEMAKLYNHYYDPDITPEQIEQMKKGSTDEDTWPRNWYNHFYDPINDRGFPFSAKEWAQNPEAQAKVSGGDHSWQTAIGEYNAGYKQKAFYSLGHILHLIEDMAVPAHTREDPHVSGDPLEDWAGNLPKDSAFYNIAQPLINKGIKPKIFNNLNAYFDEVANFSNRNFFSNSSIGATININTGQPIPNVKYSSPQIVKEGWENGKKYGYGKIPGTSNLIRLIRIDKDDKGNTLYFLKYKKEDSPEIHADYFLLLSKEAVINGAGVIKLFFESTVEPSEEIIEAEKKLSFWQKIGNIIEGSVKFVVSAVDGLIHTPLPVIGTVTQEIIQETMPVPEYLTIGPKIIEPAKESIEINDEAEAKPPIPPQGGFASGLPNEEKVFLVKKVIDGDTIVLENGQEVRYIGIDAPEFPNGCFAKEAADKNKELVEGKQIRLEKDVSETDNYGRLLRYVYIDELFINDYLIRNGYARNWVYEPDTKYKTQLAKAEKEAKENRRGLWGDICHPTIVHGSKTSGGGGAGAFSKEEPAPAPAEVGTSAGEQQDEQQDQQQEQQEQQEIVYGDVVINEIAWMGTQAQDNDEWIEIYNASSNSFDLTGWILEAGDGIPTINLKGIIASKSFFLLERTSDETISNIEANQIYTGALNNEGEILRLKDNNGNIIDEVDCGEGWFAGDNDEKRTMERVQENWQTYSGSGSTAVDVDGNPIFGTPKAENSSLVNDDEGSVGDNGTGDDANHTIYTPVDGHITQDTTWTLKNSPYLVYDNTGQSYELLEIAEGVTLTIEPGVIVKFMNPGLKVFGTIKAEGTPDNPIVFTSYNDDEYGGDVFEEEDDALFCKDNPDDSSRCPQPGFWSGIWITKSSRDSVFDNVIIRYAGSRTRPFRSGFTYSFPDVAVGAGIRVENTSIILKNSIIEHNLFVGVLLTNSPNTIIENSIFQNHLKHDNSYTTMAAPEELRNMAVYVDSSSPQIQNSTFQNNLTGIYIINNSAPIIENNNFSNNLRPIWVYNSYPEFSGNQIEGNQWDGIVIKGLKLTQDYTLGGGPTSSSGGSVFINYEEIPSWSIVVPKGYTLTIEPGTIIKSLPSTAGLIVEGTLIAEGVAEKPIVFTSFYDDEYGGDTNGDGDATKDNVNPGSWGQIVFTETSTDSILNYAIIRYGGTKWGQSYNYQPDYVLRVENSRIAIANSIFENNTSGARLENSNSHIANTEFKDHRYSRPFSYFTSTGIYLSSSRPTIDISTFLNNKLGIYIDINSWLDLTGLVFESNDKDFEDKSPM